MMAINKIVKPTLFILILIFINILLVNIITAQNESELPLQQNTTPDLSTAQNESELPLQQNDSQNIQSYECGNNKCEFNETIICPEDCNNCSTEEDCNDNNLCTKDICEGTPKECTHIPFDCDDKNPCTTDLCTGIDCKHELITSCISGDGCCQVGCTYNLDSDCKPEPPRDNCLRGSECDDNNPCTEDACEGKPQMCSYKKLNGCPLGNQCLGYGARRDIDGFNSYCDASNSWKPQKTDKTLCSDDYECMSNKCSDGECIKPAREPKWWEKFLGWLFSLIGLIK